MPHANHITAMPDVDAIIPTLARPEHCLNLLRDLAAQTVPLRRVFLIEQSPEPGAASELQPLTQMPWPFELCHRLVPWVGACRARNAAIAEAAAEWLFLLDDDIRLEPDCVSGLIELGSAYGVDAVNAAVREPSERPTPHDGVQMPFCWRQLGSGSALVRRDAALRAGPFDERLEGGFGEDWEFGLRLRLTGANVLAAPAVRVLHLKAPRGGFRFRFPHPWLTDKVQPCPSPTFALARRLHYSREQQCGYRLAYLLKRLRASAPWRWPGIFAAWRRAEYWALRLELTRTAAPAPTSDVRPVREMLVITHCEHAQTVAGLTAYGPFVREMDVWASLCGRLVMAAPASRGPAPGDAVAYASGNVRLVELPNIGLTPRRRLLLAALLLPVCAGRLLRLLWQAEAVHVRCPGNMGLLGVILAPAVFRLKRALGRVSRRGAASPVAAAPPSAADAACAARRALPLIAKYAGQWNGYPGEPWTYRLQRRLLRSRWWGAPVTVYGAWPGDPPHVLPFFSTAFSQAQMAVAGNVAAQREFGPQPRLLFAGRLTRQKHVDTILEALAQLRETGVVATLTVLGDGPELGSLQRLATRLDLARQASFAGAVGMADMPSWYGRHDVLVLVSESEGWPKAIAEAMAFGMICVGASRGMVPQMLQDGRGFVVPPGDKAALASCLEGIVRMPAAERAEMSRRAAAWAQRFTLENLREALRGVMSEWWGA